MGEAEKRTLRRDSDRRLMLQRVEAAYPPNFAAARSDGAESYPQKSGNPGNLGSRECRFEAVT